MPFEHHLKLHVAERHTDGVTIHFPLAPEFINSQGVLHGANEAFRAEFQARRTPGMRRTRTGIGVDTYRPLNVSPEFARMSG